MKTAYSSESSLVNAGDFLTICSFVGEQTSFARDLDKKNKGKLNKLAKVQDFTGKIGQLLRTEDSDFSHIFLLGLGKKSDFCAVDMQNIGARVAKLAQAERAKNVVLCLPTMPTKTVEPSIYFSALGVHLGLYTFDKYKSSKNHHDKKVTKLTIYSGAQDKRAHPSARLVTKLLNKAKIVAAATAQARDLVNEPASFMTPSQMASEARRLAKTGKMSLKVLGHDACKKLGMGLFLAVSRGSEQKPQFLHMTYKPPRAAKKRIAIIGKGVMFDSGGYSLKPSAAMLDMKIDMAGSAAVLSAMAAIAKIGSPYEIHAVAACCENMVSGRAYKLGDVFTAMDGTTVEINNTDAEGRLTLGDAITYARQKIKPDEIFDLATLTGACMVALGPYTAGVLSKDNDLTTRWLDAAQRAGEDMWRLPLNSKLKKQLKSTVADTKNTGERYGGAITAGLFLAHFAKDSPWLHVDLAGPASSSGNSEDAAIPKGGTGFGVATLIEYLTQ